MILCLPTEVLQWVVHGVKLEIVAFTRGKPQLSQRDVELSKQLSKVRIHVERVIGNLKNKYTISKGPLPLNLVKHKRRRRSCQRR